MHNFLKSRIIIKLDIVSEFLIDERLVIGSKW